MLTFSSKPRLRSRRQHDGSSPGRGLAPLSRPVEDPVDSDLIDEEVSARKGWHDSSSDLKRGLDVVENVPLDTLPPDLRDDFTPRRR